MPAETANKKTTKGQSPRYSAAATTGTIAAAVGMRARKLPPTMRPALIQPSQNDDRALGNPPARRPIRRAQNPATKHR